MSNEKVVLTKQIQSERKCPPDRHDSGDGMTSGLSNSPLTLQLEAGAEYLAENANVGRIMKRMVPDQGKVAKDAKECCQECVSEFISFITSEASERCQFEKRKTINGEDIIFALATLGFDPYVEPLKQFLNKYRDAFRGMPGSEGGGKPMGEGGSSSAEPTSGGVVKIANNTSGLSGADVPLTVIPVSGVNVGGGGQQALPGISIAPASVAPGSNNGGAGRMVTPSGQRVIVVPAGVTGFQQGGQHTLMMATTGSSGRDSNNTSGLMSEFSINRQQHPAGGR